MQIDRIKKQVSPSHIPILVIVGQTATGKSALALGLAERLGGEILCADSRTVYRGMDIGTAKPSAADQLRVPHWGLDLVTPDELYTAAEFKVYAQQAIAEIHSRGKLPIMVGGSGMYIDAVLYDYNFEQPANVVLRAELNALSLAELQQRILELGLEMPADIANPRRLMRVIETGGVLGSADRKRGIRENTLVIGLEAEIEILEQRIANRVDEMVEAGFVDEVRRLGDTYGWEVQAMQAPGYKAFRDYIAGSKTLNEAKAEFVKYDRALAKRQRTWFKRNKSIHWLTTEDKLAEAVDIATTFLNT